MIVVIAFTASILTYLFTFEIIRSVTILVVFCPCALVLATPTALMAATSNLTKYGILVKNGESIEELAHVDEVIFDKTGTLTYGTPTVIKVTSKNPEEMMQIVTSLESKSEHPLAKAIVKYYNNKDLTEVNDFKIHIGKGITGTIKGEKAIVGNKKFLESEGIKINSLNDNKNGEIEIFVAKEKEHIGTISLADTIRNNSKPTIRNLKKLRIKTILLTGDNENTAKSIANQLKINNIKFNCLPEDKIKYIQDEQIRNHRVAMIGDGINDAPSLRKSNVGISMGKIGSDLSIESSNITLIKDNIENIPHLIEISKKTIRTINISIGFALTLNVLAMALAILGILNPIEGALIHNIGSVIVIIYSSILVNYKSSKIDYKTEQFDLYKTLNITMNNYNL